VRQAPVASFAAAVIAILSSCAIAPAQGEEAPGVRVLRRTPPFVATLSNHAPLVVGMSPAEAADALRSKLTYVGGRRNHEIYLAVSDAGSSLFFPRRDHLYLQFRHDRLTGWKGDWNLDETWR
jgi:hypothetical protein